jgi:hypothetical protein
MADDQHPERERQDIEQRGKTVEDLCHPHGHRKPVAPRHDPTWHGLTVLIAIIALAALMVWSGLLTLRGG